MLFLHSCFEPDLPPGSCWLFTNCLGVDGQLVDGALVCLVLWGIGACRGVIAFGAGAGGWAEGYGVYGHPE